MVRKIPAKGSENLHFNSIQEYAAQIMPADADCENNSTGPKENENGIRVYSGRFPGSTNLDVPDRFFQLTSEQAEASMYLRLESFLGGFTHYFNNLMMGIQGNLALMLLQTPPGGAIYGDLKRIEDVIEAKSLMPLRLLDIAACGNSSAFSEGYFNDLKRFSKRRKQFCSQKPIAEKLNEPRPAVSEGKMPLIFRLCHEIICSLSSLLAEIQDAAAHLSKSVKQGSRDHHKLKTIGNLVGKGQMMVERLTRFVGTTENKGEFIDINQAIIQVIRSFEENYNKIRFQPKFNSTFHKIEGNRALILEMLQHLLENAAEAQLDDASIQIETYDVCKNPQKNGDADPKDSDSLCIKISDTGIGMSPETCQQIFDPFFTAGKSYGHKGLGLCAVLGIVKKHSGLIVVKTLQGKGTSISLCFPMTAQTNRITRG